MKTIVPRDSYHQFVLIGSTRLLECRSCGYYLNFKSAVWATLSGHVVRTIDSDDPQMGYEFKEIDKLRVLFSVFEWENVEQIIDALNVFDNRIVRIHVEFSYYMKLYK